MLKCPSCDRANPTEAAFCHHDGAALRPEQTAATVASSTSTRTVPILDLQPRRIWLRDLNRTSRPRQTLRLTNRGGDTLIGHLRISQGADWLSLDEATPTTTLLPVETTTEQQIDLHVDPSQLAVPGEYLAKLELRTNGGTHEIPVQADLRATPFPDPDSHWTDVPTPRELGRRMVESPRKAIQILTNGRLAEWFTANGWEMPEITRPAPGMGAVQQFLERMRLASVPEVTFLPDENAPHVEASREAGLAYECRPTDGILHGAIKIGTRRKKWVYAVLESDADWLSLGANEIVGPREALLRFSIDVEELKVGHNEGNVRIWANGEQELILRVVVELLRPEDPFTRRLVRGLGFTDD